MKILKIILTSTIVLTIALLSITSCSDGFLDENQKTIPTTDHFKTEKGLDDLVVGSYANFKFKFNYVWSIQMFNLGVD